MSYKFIYGEADGVNIEVIEEWMEKMLPSLECTYSKKDIFNTDETDCFLISSQIKQTMKGESVKVGSYQKCD